MAEGEQHAVPILAGTALLFAVLLQGTGFTGLACILLFLTVGLTARVWCGWALVLSPLALLVLGWFAWLLLSLLWARVDWVALRAAMSMSVLPLGFFIAATQADKGWKSLRHGILLAGGIVVLWGAWQLWQGDQPRAGFGQRNLAGAFVLPVALCATGRWLRSGGAGDGMAGLSGWLFVAVVQSRGLWLAALPAVALLLAACRPVPGRRRLLAGMLVSLALALSLLHSGGLAQRSERDLVQVRVSLAEGEPAPQAGSSLGQRLVIWRAALRMLEQAPWYGIGAQHFYQLYPAWITPQDQSAGQYAHNDYLQLLIELGWPGLLLTVAIYLLAAGRSWARLRSGELAPDRQVEIASLLAGITAIALHALVSYDHYVVPILLLLGLLLGRLDRLTLPPGEGRPVVLTLPRRWLTVAASVAIVLTALPAASEWYHRQGTQRLAVGDLAGAEAALARAAALFDTDEVEYARAITYLEALKALPDGEAERRSRLHGWALEALEKAGRINPWNANVQLGQGLLEQAATVRRGGRSAGSAWRRCLEMDPRHFLCREQLARLLARQGAEREARRLLEEGTAWPFPDEPAIAPYMELLADLRERQGDGEAAGRLRQQLARLREHWKQESGAVSLSP